MIAPRSVVDASVAVKWVVDEDLSERALALYAQARAQRQPLLAPPHMPGEVTNAIYQRLRSTRPERQLDVVVADAALARVHGYLQVGVEILSPPDLYPQAYALAKAHRLPSVYDAVYVVLAQILGAELWTADERLLAAVGANAPWVRHLRDFTL